MKNRTEIQSGRNHKWSGAFHILMMAGCVLMLWWPGGEARGVPFAKNFIFVQPDGTELKLWGEGDDFHAIFETLDGFTVVFEPSRKAYYYAQRAADGKALVSTGVPAHQGPPPGLLRHARMDQDAVAAAARALRTKWDADVGLSKRWAELKARTLGTPLPNGGPQPAPPPNTTVGAKEGLTLLIDFPDAAGTVARSEIDGFCNGDSYTGFGNNGSVKKYYQDVSAGRLTYSNVVTIYVRMTQPKSYYNDTSKDCGIQGRLLINDAMAILKARADYPTVILPTFSALTTDVNNRVVAFNVFYAGGDSGVWSYGLWPHSWVLAEPIALGNGKFLYAYEITNIGTSLALGTFCHENGHMLCGFPDIYDYDYDSKGGAGAFCLMNSGGHGPNPAQVCGYLKLAAGWTTPIDLDKDSESTATLAAAPTAGYDQVYRFRRPGVSTEYFLFENRENSGRDATLPASGIAVWHVDELGDRDNQSLTPNSSHLNYELTLVQADSQWHFEWNINSGDAYDLFYQGNLAAGYLNRFNDSSTPNAHWWDGSASELKLSNFSSAAMTMTFRIGAVHPTGPLLAAEPKVTPGTSNTIYWSTGNQLNLPSEVTLGAAEALTPPPAVKAPTSDATADDGPSPGPDPAWQDLTTEDFEGAFPGTKWTLYGGPYAGPTWGATTYAAHSGSSSGWCGASSLPPAGGYVDGMQAWMIYGPFSLADASNARVRFWYKNSSEEGFDRFGWYASINGDNFYGAGVSGDQNTWRQETNDLSNVYTLGNLCGQPQVWIAFVFQSDVSVSALPGAYLDDIVLEKDVGAVQTDYLAECANNPSFDPAINSGWLQQTQYTFGPLTLGKTYWYRVKSRQGTQESAWSNVERSQQGGPLVENVSVESGTNYTVRTCGLSGESYILQASTNLVNWVNVATNTAGSDGSCALVESTEQKYAQRFYRVLYICP